MSRTLRPLEAFLLLLVAERPGYGAELYLRLGELMEGLIPPRGEVYRALCKLHRAGALTLRLHPGLRGTPRKVYALTPQGRALLQRWAEEVPRRLANLQRFQARYRVLSMPELSGEQEDSPHEPPPGQGRACP